MEKHRQEEKLNLKPCDQLIKSIFILKVFLGGVVITTIAIRERIL
jgi:hypothetical protein